MGKAKIVGIIVAAVAVVCIVGGGIYLSTNKSAKNKVVAQNNSVQATQNTSQNKTENAPETNTKKDNTDSKPADSNKTESTQAQNKTESTQAQDKTQSTQAQNKVESSTTNSKDNTADSTTNSKNDAGTTNAQPPVGATISQIVPNGNIIESAKSYAVPANEVNQMIAGKYKGDQKMVFLTFDDGPSVTNTPKILNILKQYGVHATFFVLGSELKSEAAKNILKDEIMSGNAIADHSYTHDYKVLYPNNSVNVSTFMNEFNETNNIMRSVLGNNFNARIVRMPGGYMSRAYYHDKNLPALNAAFAKQGIESIDWTAESGDAEPQNYSVSQLVQNAINESKGYNHVVLLMHDIKPKTVQALPQIIEYYKSQGYEFKVISNSGIN